MPKKNLLIAGVVVLLLVIAGVGFMIMSKSSGKSAEDLTVGKDSAKDTTVESTTKGSIRSLLSGGKNITCTVVYPDNVGGGTMFIADKKMRGDFTTKDAGGKQIESHMLQDGEFIYSWMGAQGVKMKIDTGANASPAAGSAQQGADLDKQQDMNCSSWSVDNSKFILPTDVKFMDATAFTGQTQTQTQTQTGTGTNGSSAIKAACESITDPANKAACLKAAESGGY